MPLVFAITLFLSATLLFLVQPMIAKMILPKFGGTPAVWINCMLFFQATLLAGYSYAHVTTKWLGIRRQVPIHLALMILPFLFLPIAVAENYSPPGDVYPIIPLLKLLVITVGLPFFVISTSAPLLQKWYANTGHPTAKDPYFLYAASNLGSMISLVAYPWLMEPNFRLPNQGVIWEVGYAVVLIATAVCAFLLWRSPGFAEIAVTEKQNEQARFSAPEPGSAAVTEKNPDAVSDAASTKAGATAEAAKSEAPTAITAVKPKDHSPAAFTSKKPKKKREAAEPSIKASTFEVPTPGRRVNWIALAFVPSSLMLGVTTYLTTDIAPIPLLWIIPLALYLLSFILVFANMPPIIHKILVLAMPVAALLLVFMILSGVQPKHLTMVFLVHLLTFFLICMVCHGELARTRPSTKYLTEFYLLMSLGGVLGGIFNAIVAPIVFTSVAEYRVALVLACLVLPPITADVNNKWTKIMDLGLPTVLGMLATALMFKHSLDVMNIENLPPEGAAFQIMSILLYLPGWLMTICLLVLLVGIAAGYVYYSPREREKRVLHSVMALSFLPALLGTLAAGMILLHWLDGVIDLSQLTKQAEWPNWYATIYVLGLMASLIYIFYSRKDRENRALDIAVAVALGVLATGIILRPPIRNLDLTGLSKLINVEVYRLNKMVIFGLPALFCYVFVERPVRFGLCVGAFLFAGLFCEELRDDVLLRERSFFGVLNVKEEDDSDSRKYHRLVHGTTLHGKQLVSNDPAERRQAMTYYHKDGPIGQVFDDFKARNHSPPLAFVGLGTGTLASYGEPGQSVTFFEIDPTVLRIAYDPKYFTHLTDAEIRKVKLDVILGDARLQLAELRRKEAVDPKYGLIVLDAFSSDAIPIHLITKEAVLLYLDMLAEDGILAFHISNRYLNLEPVLVNLARDKDINLEVIGMSDGSQEAIGKSGSHWVLLARNQKAFGKLTSELKRWPSDDSKNWKDLMHKPGASNLTNADLEQWKLEAMRRRNGDQWKEKLPSMTNAQIKAVIQNEIDQDWQDDEEKRKKVDVWTDDYSNVLSIFNFDD